MLAADRLDHARKGRRVIAIGLWLAACGGEVRYQADVTLPPTGGPADATLFLLGDGGEITPGRDVVLRHLSSQIDDAATRSEHVLVTYLGDNIYEFGARETHRDDDFPRLAAQLEPIGDYENVRTVFLPGNHDWGQGGSDARGRAALRTLSEWLQTLADGRDVRLLPEGACPGPSTLDLGPSVHAVFIDTEWLLRVPEDDCGGSEAFYDRFTEDLRSHRDRHVMVLAHHPLASGGEHGGNQGFLAFVPTVSFLVVKAGVELQDLTSPTYRSMIERFETAFADSGAEPLLFAGGHEHNLQVIAADGGSTYHLVSGSASKSTPVNRTRGTRFATDGYGYMRLDVRGSEVRLVVFATSQGGSGIGPVYGCVLTAPDGCREATREGSAP